MPSFDHVIGYLKMDRYRFRYGGVWSSMMSENHALAFPLLLQR